MRESVRQRVVAPAKRLVGGNERLWRQAYKTLGLIAPSRSFATSSFAQYGEDIVAAIYLPEAMGSYVDIGAAHPIRHSSTYSFYKRGWSGVLVDPIGRNTEMAKARRRRDRVVQAAIADEPGTLHFYEIWPSNCSTTDKAIADARLGRGMTLVGDYDVPVMTLAMLDLEATPDQPTLLNVDVEGRDHEVLLGNDFERYRPRVICVEELTSPLRGSTPVGELLAREGYSLESYLRYTSIYVHRDHLAPSPILGPSTEE